jgi:hypothetical protein
VDPDEIDDTIAVELLNNQTDDELSLQDAERQRTTAAGCLSTATIVLAVVIVAALAFS